MGVLALSPGAKENMSEEENVQVQEEPVQEQQVAEEPKVEAPKPRNDKDENFERFRQVAAAQKAEIEALKARLEEMNKPKEEPDEFASLDPNDLLTFEQANKLAEKKARKVAEELAQKLRQEQEEKYRQQNIASDEERMRGKYQDYDYVIENFAVPLIKNDPALAYKIQHSKNPAETAYKLAKISDEYESYASQQQVSPKAEKVLKNTQRPVSGNAVGNPLKSQVEQIGKMSQQEIWEQSQRYAKGY